MATQEIKEFYFYQDYIWSPDDFTNFQTWTWGAFQSVFEGAHGAAVLKGFDVTLTGGLNFSLAAGIACGEQGQTIVDNSTQSSSVPSPGVSNQNSLVVLRPTSTDGDNIALPTNPSLSVPLHATKAFQLVVLNKVPAFENDYPTLTSGDVVVVGIKLLAGASSIVNANLDYGVASRPRKHGARIKTVTQSASIDPSVDDIIEASFSGASGVLQLPSATLYPGQRVSVVKVDSSANQVAVSGTGAETISGQSSVTLDDQWDRVTVYSNNANWRIL